jgi:hypothetical protein
MKRATCVAIGLLLCAAAAWAGVGAFRGKIVVSDQPLPSLADDGDKAMAELKKANRDTLERSKDSESWSFHMMAFLDRKAGAPQLSLMFYNTAGGKHEYLTSKDISCDPGAEILATDVDVSEEDGVKPGHKISIELTRVNGSNETVLAKTLVTFTAAK